MHKLTHRGNAKACCAFRGKFSFSSSAAASCDAGHGLFGRSRRATLVWNAPGSRISWASLRESALLPRWDWWRRDLSGLMMEEGKRRQQRGSAGQKDRPEEWGPELQRAESQEATTHPITPRARHLELFRSKENDYPCQSVLFLPLGERCAREKLAARRRLDRTKFKYLHPLSFTVNGRMRGVPAQENRSLCLGSHLLEPRSPPKVPNPRLLGCNSTFTGLR